MALTMTVAAGNAGAQDLKSVLSGVVKNVVGDKTTTESSIIGTWTYAGPECQFESDNLLAKAGGEVAAKDVEEKIQADGRLSVHFRRGRLLFLHRQGKDLQRNLYL